VRFERLVAKARALGLRGSREAMLLAALEREVRLAAEQTDCRRDRPRNGGSGEPRAEAPERRLKELALARSPYQVVVYRCERCGAAHVPTSDGMKLLGPATIGAILCDARVSTGAKRMRYSEKFPRGNAGGRALAKENPGGRELAGEAAGVVRASAG
jgi:hypothetical protein